MPVCESPPTIIVDRVATTLPDDGFVVFCGDDRKYDGSRDHVVASRQVFASYDEAHDFAMTCAPSRNPVIIPTSAVHRLIEGWYPARRPRARSTFGRPANP
jgi:hypothetical protein